MKESISDLTWAVTVSNCSDSTWVEYRLSTSWQKRGAIIGTVQQLVSTDRQIDSRQTDRQTYLHHFVSLLLDLFCCDDVLVLGVAMRLRPLQQVSQLHSLTADHRLCHEKAGASPGSAGKRAAKRLERSCSSVWLIYTLIIQRISWLASRIHRKVS